MLKIGITGSIGAGKTTVCKLFENHFKIPVYYADSRAKWLMSHDKNLKFEIKQLLGNKAYHANGRLNRKYVGSKVFKDKKMLSGLNALVHPAVAKDSKVWFESLKKKPYALKEAALLLESKSNKNLDATIVVVADQETRILRVMKRDSCTRQAVLDRMNNQWSQNKKLKAADYVIENEDRKTLLAQLKKINQAIKKSR